MNSRYFFFKIFEMITLKFYTIYRREIKNDDHFSSKIYLSLSSRLFTCFIIGKLFLLFLDKKISGLFPFVCHPAAGEEKRAGRRIEAENLRLRSFAPRKSSGKCRHSHFSSEKIWFSDLPSSRFVPLVRWQEHSSDRARDDPEIGNC